MKAALLDIVDVGNTLGEGVVWDERAGAVWWTDIESCRLYRYILAHKTLGVFATPERLCAFGLMETEGMLVAAFASGFAFFEPETGRLDWIARPIEGVTGLRFNDGRVDPAGRFWCGTMAEDNRPETIAKSCLYCLGADLSVSTHLSGIHISNAICWSPDGTRMYFTDSMTQTIQAFDFDSEGGAMANAAAFATVSGEAGALVGPDGAVTDADGYLWNAQWGAARVTRYAPDGAEDFVVELPTSHITCPVFGGPDMNLLFVTSARQGLSDDRLAAEPQAGNLFIFETDAVGTPAARFRGGRP